MNKKEKRIIDEINSNVPDVNLFNRIEGKVDYNSKTGISSRRRKNNWVRVLVPTMSVVIIGTVAVTAIANGIGGKGNSASKAPCSNVLPDVNAVSYAAPYEYGSSYAAAISMGEKYEEAVEPGGTVETGTDKGSEKTSNSSQYQKTLTASEVSDIETIEKYVYWKKMIEGKLYDDKQNVINDYSSDYKSIQDRINNLITTKNMIIVSVKDNVDTNINNAKVTAIDGNGNVLFQTYSSAKGNAYLFLPTTLPVVTKVVVNYQEASLNIDIDPNAIPEDRIYTAKFASLIRKDVTNIDLAFTIDTTGSMGDELSYITQELAGIVDKLTNTYETYSLKVGIVLYRDEGDAYVTKVNDFTDAYSDVTTYLKKQNADGGGDIEEAVDQALKVTNENLSWREDSIKLVYHVYDAPAHSYNYAKLYQQYLVSANKGIKLIPVICSGSLSREFEITAREEAILTGGTYVYLTNDSGIGGSHDEPTVSESVPVEYLNDLIVRVTREYVEGIEIAPVEYTGKTQTNN